MPPPLSMRQETKHDSVLKRLPRWVYYLVVLGTLIVTLLQGYPWLHLQKDDSLNSQNPYKTMFVVVNDGYTPVTNVAISCTPTFTTQEHISVNGFKTTLNNFSSILWHGQPLTLPCIDAVAFAEDSNHSGLGDIAISSDNPILTADMTIDVKYAFVYLNLKPLRRSQSFHLRAVRGADNSFHWAYLP
jgi:hypothetical protein